MSPTNENIALSVSFIRLDIEIFDEWGKGKFAQARYLVHGHDDVLWTNSIKSALRFLRQSLEKLKENE